VNASLGRLGFRSAVLTAFFSITLSVSGLLGLFQITSFPWDPIVPHGASLLLAIAFVVMMASIHSAAPRERNHWSLIGVALAILYAALVSIVYFVTLTVVVPYMQRGQADKVAPFLFDPSGSFMSALDGLGYFFLSLATWFAAPVFAAHGRERWLRRLFIINGVLGIPILLAFMLLIIPQPYYAVAMALGFGWMLSVPAVVILVATFFRQAPTAHA
jgi:hypothetical protein